MLWRVMLTLIALDYDAVRVDLFELVNFIHEYLSAKKNIFWRQLLYKSLVTLYLCLT